MYKGINFGKPSQWDPEVLEWFAFCLHAVSWQPPDEALLGKYSDVKRKTKNIKLDNVRGLSCLPIIKSSNIQQSNICLQLYILLRLNYILDEISDLLWKMTSCILIFHFRMITTLQLLIKIVSLFKKSHINPQFYGIQQCSLFNIPV